VFAERDRRGKKKASPKSNELIDGTRIRNSHYTIFFKWMCIYIVVYTATTFRGLAAILDMQRRCEVLHVTKTPAHTSIRRWINQVGYYKISKTKEKADDWVYFIDNSIRIENRKVCLILGTCLSKLRRGHCVTYEDLEPIGIWLFAKNSDVESMIQKAIVITGVPSQICSDEGPDVMPSIRKIMVRYPKVKHVPDIMHKTGNMLKKKLEGDPRWKSFINLATDSKRSLCQSSLSCLCPPNLRGKSRFLNCQNVVEWATRGIATLEGMKDTDPNWQQMNEKLGWLLVRKQDVALFTELFRLAAITKEVVRKLHIKENSWQVVEELLREDTQSDEGRLFAKEMVNFLKIQCEKGEAGMQLAGSSEIIESAFSKLKLLDRECGNSGFTSSILGLAACFGATDYKSLTKAFEESNPKDVVAWGKNHVGETIHKKRRQMLKPNKSVDFGLKMARFLREEIKAA
jgi:hypothetical protein